MKKTAAVVLCVLLLAGLGLGVMFYTGKADSEQIENAGTSENALQKVESLEYLGEKYPLKKHIQTILLIGTDSEEEETDLPEGMHLFYNFNQADCLMLLVVDRDAERVEVIQINRDTMSDVPWLDVLGEYGGTVNKQLCLAFNSGSGGADSCQNTVHAVSNLIFNAPIQGYIQIPMSAISTVNDLVGGVPVTIKEDMTAVDASFVRGSTVLLKGRKAEKFVRARMALKDDTNLARMERQRDYLDSFQKQARKALNSDSEFTLKVIEKLGKRLQTDLTGNQLSDLLKRLDQYQVSPIRYAKGELLTGSEYYEFYVDRASLWEIIRNAYCQ